MNEPEPTLEELVEQARLLHRHIQSLNRKMEELHGRHPEVKRFVAYMQVMDEYQKVLDHTLQAVGFVHAVKENDDADVDPDPAQ